jgi:hypothetical protein
VRFAVTSCVADCKLCVDAPLTVLDSMPGKYSGNGVIAARYIRGVRRHDEHNDPSGQHASATGRTRVEAAL